VTKAKKAVIIWGSLGLRRCDGAECRGVAAREPPESDEMQETRAEMAGAPPFRHAPEPRTPPVPVRNPASAGDNLPIS